MPSAAIQISIPESGDTLNVSFPNTVTFTQPVVRTSELMRCEDDATVHRVTVRKKDGAYIIRVGQDNVAGAAAPSEIPFHCPDDDTVRNVTCRKKSGRYVLRIDQDEG